MTDDDLRPTIDDLAQRLAAVPGVAAVALGGSRATGTARPDSDVDIGLYYRAARPLDVAALDRLAARIDDRGSAGLVTAVGAWGRWIDGGGWLDVGGRRVDLLYRDVDRVAAVIDDCRAGRVAIDYQPGHPHGFVSSIYLGEAAVAVPLVDREGVLAGLRARANPYPDALADALAARFGWEARFTVDVARKAVARGDAVYVAGCLFRALACLAQVLCARHRRHLLNEKGALAVAAGLPGAPPDLAARANAVVADLRPEPAFLDRAIDRLAALVAEVGTDGAVPGDRTACPGRPA